MEDFSYQRLPARLVLRFLDLSNGGFNVQGPSYQALAELLDTSRETVGALLSRIMHIGLPKLRSRRTK